MPPGNALKNHIHTESAGLLRAAGPIHRQIPIEPGLFWDAHYLPLQLTQNDTVVLFDIRNQIQNAFQFFSGHEARFTIGAFVGIDEVAVSVILAGFAVPHPHHHDDQERQQSHTDTKTIEAVWETKYGGDAGKEIPARKLGSSAKYAAFGLPDIIVVNKLADVAAAIEQGGQGNGQYNSDFYDFFSGDGNTLLSHASRSRH